jgi:hypothetical protein
MNLCGEFHLMHFDLEIAFLILLWAFTLPISYYKMVIYYHMLKHEHVCFFIGMSLQNIFVGPQCLRFFTFNRIYSSS